MYLESILDRVGDCLRLTILVLCLRWTYKAVKEEMVNARKIEETGNEYDCASKARGSLYYVPFYSDDGPCEYQMKNKFEIRNVEVKSFLVFLLYRPHAQLFAFLRSKAFQNECFEIIKKPSYSLHLPSAKGNYSCLADYMRKVQNKIPLFFDRVTVFMSDDTDSLCSDSTLDDFRYRNEYGFESCHVKIVFHKNNEEFFSLCYSLTPRELLSLEMFDKYMNGEDVLVLSGGDKTGVIVNVSIILYYFYM